MDIHKQRLNDLILRAESAYSCQRGPRPSGASIILEGSNQQSRCNFMIYGDVVPTEGSPSCKDVGCMMVDGHCVRNIHAEVDALLYAAKHGICVNGGILYSVNKPCYNCTIAAIKAGIAVIYYAYAVYDEERTKEALKAANVLCVQIAME